MPVSEHNFGGLTMIKNKKTLYISLAFALILISILASIFFYQNDNSLQRALADKYYMSILNGNYEDALDLIYIDKDSDKIKQMLLTAYHEDNLLEYKVKDIIEVTNELYEVHSHIKTSSSGESDVKNYIALIDTEWRYILSQRHFPASYSSYIDEPFEEITILS